MKHILDLTRYNYLLEKENSLKIKNTSLLIDNRPEFIELLSYNTKLQNLFSYQNKEKYCSLISRYINNLITPQFFQWEFLELEKNDSKSAKILLNNLKKSSESSIKIDLAAIKFGSLVEEISELSEVAQEFGPKNGINDNDFSKSIKKIYLKMLALEN